MPTPRSTYTRKGGSSRTRMQCPATVTFAERFRVHLSDDHFERHFRIIENAVRHVVMAPDGI
jgi:hypothetical protein